MKHVKHIEIGAHEGMAGFTLQFDDDSREHYLFECGVAEALGRKLIDVAQFLKQTEPFQDTIGVSDYARVAIRSSKDVLN